MGAIIKGGGTGGPHDPSPLTFFLAEPGPPLPNFQFFLNKFNQQI